ncbi:MAG: WYL domain-containing protein [Erysipelotrichaceae bacterium]|nr:WYL domain-containing protein [Erysipelotrichaceae bacterium]
MHENNRSRILSLIKILRENTDIDHQLSLKNIITLLQENDIEIKNRKTLYEDFKVLSDYGYQIEYDEGYYLSESPFTISEIKVIVDSITSLKNIDDKVMHNLLAKLYSFLSKYEKKLLVSLEYHSKHHDKKFINRLEDALQAINSHTYISIKRNNNEDEIIAPLFLYRSNDYYYMYYHYKGNSKIYHTRFDNISSIKLTDTIDDISISKQQIIKNINESTNSFYSSKAEAIDFTICEDSEYLRQRLIDDFPNIIFTKKGFNINASVNEAFFSKCVSYGTKIKINDTKIANSYLEYLNKIINNHTSK